MRKSEAYINENSFGAILPENWEAVVAMLNEKIDALEEDEFGEIDKDEVDQIWEDWCNKAYNVSFQAGEGRRFIEGVNYMMVEGDDFMVYAEVELPEDVAEDYGYIALKKAITEEFAKIGGNTANLKFWYDGQGQYLSEDALVECEVYTDSDRG